MMNFILILCVHDEACAKARVENIYWHFKISRVSEVVARKFWLCAMVGHRWWFIQWIMCPQGSCM